LPTMPVRSFPETRDSPRKRILLIPVVLLVLGAVLVYLHPWLSTGFIGAIVSLTGVLTVFLVGMVFADLWASSRRTHDIIRAREKRQAETAAETETSEDPFEEEIGDS
jgi:hypothetical protein